MNIDAQNHISRYIADSFDRDRGRLAAELTADAQCLAKEIEDGDDGTAPNRVAPRERG